MYTLLTVIITSPEVRYKEILVLRKFEWYCCLQEVSRCLDNSPVINPLLSARLFSSTQHTHEPKSCSALMLLSTLLFCEQGEETQSIHYPKFNYPLTDNKPLGRRIMLEWIERKLLEEYEKRERVDTWMSNPKVSFSFLLKTTLFLVTKKETQERKSQTNSEMHMWVDKLKKQISNFFFFYLIYCSVVLSWDCTT